MKIWVLNGPNLNRLDLRDSSTYGNVGFEELKELIVSTAADLGFEAEVRASNSESEIIEWLHHSAQEKIPVVFNPAAFTHYSYAIRDAVEMKQAPLIEVHLSNPMAREEFRHTSVISGVADGTIAGFGPDSYRLALLALAQILKN